MRTTLTRATILLAMLCSLGACDDPATPDPVSLGIVLVTTTNVGAAGRELPTPVRFQIVDPAGAPQSGVAAEFRLVTGSGNISTLEAISDDEGYVETTLTFGPTPGIHQIDVSIPGTEALAQFFGEAKWPLLLDSDTVVIAAPGVHGSILARFLLPSGEEAYGRQVEYTISDSTVASLYTGMGTGTYRGQGRGILALRPGLAQVVASYEGVADTAWVHVTGESASPPALKLVEVAAGIGYPTHLTAPAGDARLFVSDLRGTVLIVEGGQTLPTPFLDIRGRVSSEGEQGFFGVAFHPNYESNGFFFISYTDLTGANRIDRYRVSQDRNVADPSSMKPIITVPQPTHSHNGGAIAFGPDGYLYISIGDGGAVPIGAEAQKLDNLLGKILRIDVDSGDPYSIPPDNPFVDSPSARDEIWAYGLRNPWRFSFDAATRQIYIADVGEIDREEVNAVPVGSGGFNFGWNRTEGSQCFPSTLPSCDKAGLTLPILEYPHARLGPDGGRSIIGGYVYRGREIPDLIGHYVHADFIGWAQSFRYWNGAVDFRQRWEIPADGLILSMGEDGFGELYLLLHTGSILKVVQAESGHS